MDISGVRYYLHRYGRHVLFFGVSALLLVVIGGVWYRSDTPPGSVAPSGGVGSSPGAVVSVEPSPGGGGNGVAIPLEVATLLPVPPEVLNVLSVQSEQVSAIVVRHWGDVEVAQRNVNKVAFTTNNVVPSLTQLYSLGGIVPAGGSTSSSGMNAVRNESIVADKVIVLVEGGGVSLEVVFIQDPYLGWMVDGVFPVV